MLPAEREVTAGDTISLTTTFSEGGAEVCFEVRAALAAVTERERERARARARERESV